MPILHPRNAVDSFGAGGVGLGRSIIVTKRPTRACVVAAVAVSAGLSAAADLRQSWRDYAGSPDNSHFSTATQIDKSNVGRLEVAWNYPYGETGFNPIVT